MTSPISSHLFSSLSNPIASPSANNVNADTSGAATGVPMKGNETFEKNFGAIFQLNLEQFKNQALLAFGSDDGNFGSTGTGSQQNSIADLATKLFPTAAASTSGTQASTLGQLYGQMVGMTIPYETFDSKLNQVLQKSGKVVGVFERDGTYFLKLEDGTSLPAVFRSADPSTQASPAA